MATLDECLLDPSRFSAADRAYFTSEPDNLVLVTGIHAIGRGEVKLGHYELLADCHRLIFTTNEGIPFMRVKVLRNPPEDRMKSRIQVSCIAEYLNTNAHTHEVVQSKEVRYILKQLGLVRTSTITRQRKRQRDIQNIGNSLADLVAKAKRLTREQLNEVFRHSRNNSNFEVEPVAINQRGLSVKTMWSALQVFSGECAVSDITDAAVQREIQSEYRRLRTAMEAANNKWVAFKEFWEKPKIVVGLLPHDRGLVLGRADFKAVAEASVAAVRDWRHAIYVSLPTEGILFKYYSTINNIEEPLLTMIKGKCGFVRMFGGIPMPRPDQYVSTDPDAVFPISHVDNVWPDINFMSYATNNDMACVNWFVMDYDGE